MGIEHRERLQYGVQFHPESIATEYGHAMLANFRDLTIEGLKKKKESTAGVKSNTPSSSPPRQSSSSPVSQSWWTRALRASSSVVRGY